MFYNVVKNRCVVLAFLSTILMTSCAELDGIWDPIKVDKSKLEFATNGGEQLVSMQNYGTWWISGGYEDLRKIDGKAEYKNYVYPTSTDGKDACTYDLLDGGWYSVTIPDKGRSNTAIVVTKENNTGQPRKATIIMTVGDAFCHIEIMQQ